MTRQRDHDKRQRLAGWRRVDVWLNPEDFACAHSLIGKRRLDNMQEVVREALKALYADYQG